MRDESGASLAEIAFVAPLFAIFIIGVALVGSIVFTYLQINNVNEAAVLYTTNNAQSLYSGTDNNGNPTAFDPSKNIAKYALSTGLTPVNSGAQLANVSVGVKGVCACPSSAGFSCSSPGQLFASLPPYCTVNPTCSVSGSSVPPSGYVCITTKKTNVGLPVIGWLSVSFLPTTLAVTAVVKIH